MNQCIGLVSLLVDDYDKAISFYTNSLKFVLVEDSMLSETKRWVVVRAAEDSKFGLLLAKASDDDQKRHIGNQTGGRVFLFLYTDDFDNYFQSIIHHGIEIVRMPMKEAYGKVAVFRDIYGNLWDLIQPDYPEK
jgi:predicted enzyme related to lactoylglutathione lyase